MQTRIPGASTLARADLKIAALYRERARQRLRRARQVPPHTRQVLIDEALVWRAFAREWARKARETA